MVSLHWSTISAKTRGEWYLSRSKITGTGNTPWYKEPFRDRCKSSCLVFLRTKSSSHVKWCLVPVNTFSIIPYFFNQQITHIRYQATTKAGCQSGDRRQPPSPSLGVSVGKYGLTNSLYHPEIPEPKGLGKLSIYFLMLFSCITHPQNTSPLASAFSTAPDECLSWMDFSFLY